MDFEDYVVSSEYVSEYSSDTHNAYCFRTLRDLYRRLLNTNQKVVTVEVSDQKEVFPWLSLYSGMIKVPSNCSLLVNGARSFQTD